MANLQNTILVPNTFDRRSQDSTSICSIADYSSLNLPKVYNFIDSIDESWFNSVRIESNDTLERVSLQAYNDTSYWDIIMLINKKSPFDCLPFDDDTIARMATNKVNRYKTKVYGSALSATSFLTLYETYVNELTLENAERYIIKIIKPSYIQEFLQLGLEKGIF